MNAVVTDAKRVFLKKGTCSQTLCFLLDREFGHLQENEERATDPLAGGLLQQGHQCGMLWGAALAAGAESMGMQYLEFQKPLRLFLVFHYLI